MSGFDECEEGLSMKRPSKRRSVIEEKIYI